MPTRESVFSLSLMFRKFHSVITSLTCLHFDESENMIVFFAHKSHIGHHNKIKVVACLFINTLPAPPSDGHQRTNPTNRGHF